MHRVPLVGEAGELAVHVGDDWLSLPALVSSRHPALARLSGGEVVMGIRPEAISLDAGDFILSAEVRTAEYLGHETLLHAKADITVVDANADLPGGSGKRLPTLTAVLPGHRPMRAGDRLNLRIDTDALSCFDLTGKAIG
jgi:multiple sugar transport system ATP-binding protein